MILICAVVFSSGFPFKLGHKAISLWIDIFFHNATGAKNVTVHSLYSDYDLKRYETFLCGLYFCFPVPGLNFVFVKGRNLNWIRNVWTQFSGAYLILLPKPLWFHSYLSITLTAREEIVFIIFEHFLQVKIFNHPENSVT